MEETYRHVNPDGSVGGAVAMSANVPSSTFLHFTSSVAPNTAIQENASIGPFCTIDIQDTESLSFVKGIETIRVM